MTRIITIVGLLCGLALTNASAAKSTGQTQAQFLTKHKATCAKKGWDYKEANAIKLFEKMDANGDGILEKEETKAYHAAKKKNK